MKKWGKTGIKLVDFGTSKSIGLPKESDGKYSAEFL